MAKTYDGYVVIEEIIKKGETKSIKPIGAALEKYKAQQIVTDDANFYAGETFGYDRVVLGDTVKYIDKDSEFVDKYTIQKCLIVTDI